MATWASTVVLFQFRNQLSGSSGTRATAGWFLRRTRELHNWNEPQRLTRAKVGADIVNAISTQKNPMLRRVHHWYYLYATVQGSISLVFYFSTVLNCIFDLVHTEYGIPAEILHWFVSLTKSSLRATCVRMMYWKYQLKGNFNIWENVNVVYAPSQWIPVLQIHINNRCVHVRISLDNIYI